MAIPKLERRSTLQTAQHVTSDVTRRMLCGGLAGMVAKTATNPLERLKMLSQTTHTKDRISILSLYRSILQKEGIRGLWAGNGANLLRVFPAKAVVFCSNDYYQTLVRRLIGNDQNAYAGFIGGGLAGMTASAVTYPLDLVRGRIAGKLAGDYRGVLSTMSLTIRDEGIRALYKGITPTLLGAMPYEGIKFGTVGLCERLFPAHDSETPRPVRKMLFGGLGGVMAGLITYPNDTVRRLLQLQGSRGTDTTFAGYWDCVRQTVRQHGVARLYRGLTINVIRMAPNTAVQFGSYEVLKNFLI